MTLTQEAPPKVHEPRRPSEALSDPELLPRRILLVEDNAEMRALLSGDLRSRGYSVVECADGTALLRRLDSTSCGSGLGVDLVVADARLPELTGLGVLEHLRDANPATPLVVVEEPFEIEGLLLLVEDAIGAPSRMPR